MTETVEVGSGAALQTAPGTAGVQSQAPGNASTVSNLASATGGIGAGNLVEVDIDEELFRFQSEDTALMSLMLKAKTVKVSSPEVDHYMIDEQRSVLKTTAAVAASSSAQFVLPLAASDQNIPRDYHTLLAIGVDGYAADGKTVTPGKYLMFFVTGRDATSNNPVVRAVNGPKTNAGDVFCTTPAIPKGTKINVLANALYETQKEVDPDLIVPRPTRLYLQKRGMNQIVSDYFDSQRKRIPFANAVIAEQAILNFKRAGNRTLWASRQSKFPVKVPKLGEQFVYTTEGARWQFKRELQHVGKWTVESLIALAKMFFTGEDVPTSALLLAGKNLLEQLQCIDFSNHPEIQIISKQNPLGWQVTRIHTVFGDIDIKREPTLDTLGWSNSGALIGEDRLVHYTYANKHEFNDRVEGEEASRKGIITWDGLGLKGSCHIWIDGGDDIDGTGTGVTSYIIWESATAPTGSDLKEGFVYLLTEACPGINAAAQAGQMWLCKKVTTAEGVTTVEWEEYNGEISVG